MKERREHGFTLIELLVVVLIIAILAAIAIPVFLAQRRKAWVSQVESVLKDASTSQESVRTLGTAYSQTFGDQVAADQATCDAERRTLRDSTTDAVAFAYPLACEGLNWSNDEVGDDLGYGTLPALDGTGVGGVAVLFADRDGYCLFAQSANDPQINGWFDSEDGSPYITDDGTGPTTPDGCTTAGAGT